MEPSFVALGPTHLATSMNNMAAALRAHVAAALQGTRAHPMANQYEFVSLGGLIQAAAYHVYKCVLKYIQMKKYKYIYIYMKKPKEFYQWLFNSTYVYR